MREQKTEGRRQKTEIRRWVDEEREIFKRLKRGFYRLPMEDKKEVVEYVEFLGEVG